MKRRTLKKRESRKRYEWHRFQQRLKASPRLRAFIADYTAELTARISAIFEASRPFRLPTPEEEVGFDKDAFMARIDTVIELGTPS